VGEHKARGQRTARRRVATRARRRGEKRNVFATFVVDRVRRSRRQALVRRVRRPPRSPDAVARSAEPTEPSEPRATGGGGARFRRLTRRLRRAVETRSRPLHRARFRAGRARREKRFGSASRCFRFRRLDGRSFSRPETHLGVGVLGEAGIEDTVGDLSGRVWRMRRQRSVRDASRGSRGTRHFGVAAARFSRSRLAKKRRSALKESARIDKSRSRTWSASLSG
jgi:hypothetical protein